MYVEYIKWVRNLFPDQPPYQWSAYEGSPLALVKKPLSELRILLLSTGGIFHKPTQEPFNPQKNDYTLKLIPKQVNVGELGVSHDNYDTDDVKKDINCVFPIERFLDLEKEGFIGALSSINLTIMGRLFSKRQVHGKLIPEIIQVLRENAADLLFLVPA